MQTWLSRAAARQKDRGAAANRQVAVLGASGHTGRHVVAELHRRGLSPIPIGRRPAAEATGGAPPRMADFADPASLDRAVAGAAAIINCAGPFFDTAEPAIAAALRGRIAYLDVTAEQITALTTFHRHHQAAVEAGVAILPAMAFYGGLADLMATAAMADWREAERISVAVALDSWHPTQGTRLTGARNVGSRFVLKAGRLDWLDVDAPHVSWQFPQPFGPQEMAHVPLSEVITISRHLAVGEIVSLMNLAPLKDLRDASTPPPTAANSRGRSDQLFVIEVKAETAGTERKLSLTGRDIYAFSAEFVAEAALWLCDGRIRQTGALAAGMAVEAGPFLAALAERSDDLVVDRSGF